ncbi:acylphosphatase [bacterium]|nr:acylphosphatase [bacterium]
MKIRTMVTVKGLVQGVSYRYFTVQKAVQLNVAGWVKNLPNGDVQGCFEGEERDVLELIDWCRVGPDRAQVDRVTVDRMEFTGEFKEFHVR